MTGGYLYTGGLTGLNAGVVQNSFAAGEVTAWPDSDAVGGFAGENSGVITACYWDVDITGQSGSDGGDGRRTSEMTFPHASNTYGGWDFAETWVEDVEPALNGGYPYLRENPPLPEDNCDDGDPCTVDFYNWERCACETIPMACDDNNPCTGDVCVDGACVFTPILCDDSDWCTTDVCVDGQCVYTPVTCDDDNACTSDTCDPAGAVSMKSSRVTTA